LQPAPSTVRSCPLGLAPIRAFIGIWTIEILRGRLKVVRSRHCFHIDDLDRELATRLERLDGRFHLMAARGSDPALIYIEQCPPCQ
jgi:hypothetical protein